MKHGGGRTYHERLRRVLPGMFVAVLENSLSRQQRYLFVGLLHILWNVEKGDGMTKFKDKIKDIGLDLAVVGCIISCVGVVANNLMLDHILAMQIWMFSNLVLLVWAYGLYRKWWDGGLSGLVLCVMYLFYTVTNVWGLMHV